MVLRLSIETSSNAGIASASAYGSSDLLQRHNQPSAPDLRHRRSQLLKSASCLQCMLGFWGDRVGEHTNRSNNLIVATLLADQAQRLRSAHRQPAGDEFRRL